jgi:hypothetical protein
MVEATAFNSAKVIFKYRNHGVLHTINFFSPLSNLKWQQFDINN